MRWFRFYDEALDDPKVQRLSPELFKAWVNLLCLASRNGGTLPSDRDELAFSMRMSAAKLSAQVDALIAAGLLDQDETLHPHNWNGRQYESDSSATRVKRWRERHRNDACNVTETPPETPPDTETESDTEQKQREGVLLALAAWQQLAGELGLAKVAKLTKTRQASLKARVAEHGPEGFYAVLAKIRGSPFLRGENDRGWKVDFDFVVSESGFTKLMEGKYDGGSRVQRSKSGGLTGFAAVAAELAAGRGFGPLVETGDGDGEGMRGGEMAPASGRGIVAAG